MTNILPRYVIIKNIKIKEYTLNENNHDNERCPICLEDLKNPRQTACHHKFCFICIKFCFICIKFI